MKKVLSSVLIVLLVVLSFTGLFLPFLSLRMSDFEESTAAEASSGTDVLGATVRDVSYTGLQLIMGDFGRDTTLLGTAMGRLLVGSKVTLILSYVLLLFCLVFFLQDGVLSSFLGAGVALGGLACNCFTALSLLPRMVHQALASSASRGAAGAAVSLGSEKAGGLVVKLLSESDIRLVFLKGTRVGWWILAVSFLLLFVLLLLKAFRLSGEEE